MTPQALADIRDAMQRALADSDSEDRAQLLELINRQIMDHVKFATPAAKASTALTAPNVKDFGMLVGRPCRRPGRR
jgi:hypothetical protein